MWAEEISCGSYRRHLANIIERSVLDGDEDLLLLLLKQLVIVTLGRECRSPLNLYKLRLNFRQFLATVRREATQLAVAATNRNEIGRAVLSDWMS